MNKVASTPANNPRYVLLIYLSIYIMRKTNSTSEPGILISYSSLTRKLARLKVGNCGHCLV